MARRHGRRFKNAVTIWRRGFARDRPEQCPPTGLAEVFLWVTFSSVVALRHVSTGPRERGKGVEMGENPGRWSSRPRAVRGYYGLAPSAATWTWEGKEEILVVPESMDARRVYPRGGPRARVRQHGDPFPWVPSRSYSSWPGRFCRHSPKRSLGMQATMERLFRNPRAETP